MQLPNCHYSLGHMYRHKKWKRKNAQYFGGNTLGLYNAVSNPCLSDVFIFQCADKYSKSVTKSKWNKYMYHTLNI